MNGRQVTGLSRSFGMGMTRRRLLAFGATAALGAAFWRTAGLAADDRPEQKRLAKKSVLERGVAWLQEQQLSDGSFPNVAGTSDFGTTLDAVSTLVALRNIGVDVEIDAAVAYLEEHGAELNDLALGGEGRLVMPLVAAGLDPRDFAGVDLIERVTGSWDASSGRYGVGDPALHYFALLGLAAAGDEIPEEAIASITAIQIADGSWSYGGGTEPGSGDTLITALVVQTLAAAGHRSDPAIESAIAYLLNVRDASGAFGFSPGAPPDTLTTAFVVSALSAAGERRTGETWKPTLNALIAFQNESGAFRYVDEDPGDDIQATIGALLALSGGSLPVLPADAEPGDETSQSAEEPDDEAAVATGTDDEAATGTESGSFTDPIFGWSIVWNPELWEAEGPIASVGENDKPGNEMDFLGKDYESMGYVRVASFATVSLDPAAGVDFFKPKTSDELVGDGAVVENRQEPDLEFPAAPDAAARRLFTYNAGAPPDQMTYLECRTLVEGEALLIIEWYLPDVARYEEALPAFNTFIVGLDLSGAHVASE